MYVLWNEMHPIHNTKLGSALFCSGRSPVLYLLGQGRFDEGEAAFRDFLRVHPEHKLAGNARYWIAETLYARQRYQEAATAFLEAWQADQRGAKAPDNLLKLGMSLQRLEKKPEACASFQKLLSDYRGASRRLRAAASRERSALGC